MKKWSFFILVIAMVAFAGNLEAATYTETFLGDIDDDAYWVLGPEGRASFHFDLTLEGNTSTLVNTDPFFFLWYYRETTPSQDVSGFDPALTVTGGTLSLFFSSWDGWADTVTIYQGDDQSNPIGDASYAINELGGTDGWETDRIDIDLGDLGLLTDLNDGIFVSMVFAPDTGGFISKNDIRIQSASLTLEAVPVPASVLLLGSGLLGLIGWRRK